MGWKIRRAGTYIGNYLTSFLKLRLREMNTSEIKRFIKEYGYLFWWIRESEKENVNLNALVEAVLNFGDKQCVKKLFELIGIKKAAEIFYQDTDRERVNYYPEVVNFFNLYFKKNV